MEIETVITADSLQYTITCSEKEMILLKSGLDCRLERSQSHPNDEMVKKMHANIKKSLCVIAKK